VTLFAVSIACAVRESQLAIGIGLMGGFQANYNRGCLLFLFKAGIKRLETFFFKWSSNREGKIDFEFDLKDCFSSKIS
jgi:hypothetical protein